MLKKIMIKGEIMRLFKIFFLVMPIILFFTFVNIGNCGWLDKGKALLKGVGSHTFKSSDELTISDIAGGLKDALRVGTSNVVSQLGTTDGFLKDSAIHIPLPKKSSILPAKRYKKPKLHIVITEKKKHKKASKLILATKPHKSPVRYHSHKHELIVIDAGHGGHDTGAIGGGKREKDLVLSIAKKVAKELKKRGYPIYLTRNSNRFLKLSQRTHIADKKGSIAFISIHANSVPKKYRNKVHGVETFFLQNTRDAKSQRIAARENAAVLKGAGSRLSKKVIIDSVLNGPKIIESNKLAIAVQRRIITNLRKKYRGVKDGGVRHAPFYVLVGASRPSILVEVGYISNPKERARLFTSRYQTLIAKGIAEGVSNYLNNRRKEIDL